MSAKQQNNRKNANQRRKQQSAADKQRLPSLEPYVTTDAPGGAQTGVRVGFPAQRRVKLAYVQNATLTSNLGVQASSKFRLNGAYDPWQTSTGHQPMGFDQWSEYYNHYVVLSCEWTVTMAPTSNTGLTSYVGVAYSDDLTFPSDIETLVESGAQITLHAKGTIPHVFRGKVDIAKFFNRTGDIANDPDLRALTVSDPSEVAFLNLFCYSEGDSAVTQSYLLELTYDIKFFEPKDLAPSFKMVKELEAKEGKKGEPTAQATTPSVTKTIDGVEWFRL